MSYFFYSKENLKISENENARDELILWVFGITAQFERAMIKERQKEGIAIAKSKGIYKGGKSKFTKAMLEELKTDYKTGFRIKDIAQKFKVTSQCITLILKKYRNEIGYRLKQNSILKDDAVMQRS